MKQLSDETVNLLYVALFLTIAIGGIILLLLMVPDGKDLYRQY